MAALFAALGSLDGPPPPLTLALYGGTFLFSNFGPNSTTFILPAETFPAHLRATLNGVCAAAGKVGAVVGAALFKPLAAAASVRATLLACAAISLLGAGVTALFVEDRRGRRLEEESEPPHHCGTSLAAEGGSPTADAEQAITTRTYV
jgi:PHS family inorganic phosphate transporter-like MFS transporter